MIPTLMVSPRRDPSPHPTLPELRAWYDTPVGRALAGREQELLAQHLPDLFGYHLLVLDPPCPQEALASSRISHIILQSRPPCSGSGDCGLEGEAERLPFSTDTLDAILLPHVLECSLDPHQVLREVERCLVPEGHVLILGFNPVSWWGLWGLVARWRHPIPWRLHGIGPGRLSDWLSLLGFDTLHSVPLFHRPPLQSESALERLRFLEPRRPLSLLAGAYFLLARKRVATLTPIRPRWRPRRGLLGAGGMAEPTNRSRHERG
jgi:SAM-dependent methyltransferase